VKTTIGMRAKATWLLLTLGVLLGSCPPSGAQTRSTQLSLMQQRPSPSMTLLAASSSHVRPTNLLLPVRSPEQRPARFAAVLTTAYNRDFSLERLLRTEVVETPFIKQARVTIVQLGGGRLQLGGFASAYHMENVLLGLSASGGLPPSRAFIQGHPGKRVPRKNGSYGLSLTFRLG